MENIRVKKNVLQESSVARPAVEKKEGRGSKRKNVGGRPPVAEKRTVKITLALTEREGRALAKKAGMVPHARFVLAELYEAGFFKE